MSIVNTNKTISMHKLKLLVCTLFCEEIIPNEREMSLWRSFANPPCRFCYMKYTFHPSLNKYFFFHLLYHEGQV